MGQQVHSNRIASERSPKDDRCTYPARLSTAAPNLEATQVPSKRRTDKQRDFYTAHKIFPTGENAQSRQHYGKQKKPEEWVSAMGLFLRNSWPRNTIPPCKKSGLCKGQYQNWSTSIVLGRRVWNVCHLVWALTTQVCPISEVLLNYMFLNSIL